MSTMVVFGGGLVSGRKCPVGIKRRVTAGSSRRHYSYHWRSSQHSSTTLRLACLPIALHSVVVVPGTCSPSPLTIWRSVCCHAVPTPSNGMPDCYVTGRGVVGQGRGGTASRTFFRQGDASPLPHFFGLKFVQKLVHCCSWILTETQCKITTNKPFIGFWQPRKAGLNKHTETSCIHNIHKITSLEMI